MAMSQSDETSDENPQPRKRGCAILFVPTLIVGDLVGMLARGPNEKLVSALALAGFACGGVIGACYWAKRKTVSRRSLSFWVVSFGLIGTTIMLWVFLRFLAPR
jgi:hypothetical protein